MPLLYFISVFSFFYLCLTSLNMFFRCALIYFYLFSLSIYLCVFLSPLSLSLSFLLPMSLSYFIILSLIHVLYLSPTLFLFLYYFYLSLPLCLCLSLSFYLSSLPNLQNFIALVTFSHSTYFLRQWTWSYTSKLAYRSDHSFTFFQNLTKSNYSILYFNTVYRLTNSQFFIVLAIHKKPFWTWVCIIKTIVGSVFAIVGHSTLPRWTSVGAYPTK